jgi:hypothetical protein
MTKVSMEQHKHHRLQAESASSGYTSLGSAACYLTVSQGIDFNCGGKEKSSVRIHETTQKYWAGWSRSNTAGLNLGTAQFKNLGRATDNRIICRVFLSPSRQTTGHTMIRRRLPSKSGLVDFFNLPNPSSRTMALGSTRPLKEMSTRYLPGGKGRRARKVDLTDICEPTVLKMWKPRRLTTQWAFTAC